MYAFILNMWIMGRVTEQKVYSYVPRFLTKEEADMIVTSPRAV